MIEYDSFWFTVLIIIGIVFISLAILFAVQIAYSEELACIEYSDGQIAIINSNGLPCSFQDAIPTIKWFISKGYEVVSITQNTYANHDAKVYMIR